MRSHLLGGLVVALTLTTAACGADVEPAPAGSAASAGEPVTIEGVNGSVELERPAERVVALEWTYAEDLVAAGVQPAGVADVAGYDEWVGAPALDESVTDVGTRQEPSLESIAALEPDLIVGVQFRHEPILEQLEAIAPTVLFNPYPAGDGAPTQLEEMEQTFREIATAVGREEQAEEVLQEMEETFADAAEQLAAADLPTERVALAQGFTAEQVPTVRMFTDNAMAVEILGQLGLENAWPGEPDPYGFTAVDVEALTQVGDTMFLYIAPAEDNIFTGALADNQVWQNLPFVAADRVRALDEATWLFGGPLSAQEVATETVAALTT
jgi:ABC-type Fe3+-hydroxamate transport system substrate-binding protein